MLPFFFRGVGLGDVVIIRVVVLPSFYLLLSLVPEYGGFSQTLGLSIHSNHTTFPI